MRALKDSLLLTEVERPGGIEPPPQKSSAALSITTSPCWEWPWSRDVEGYGQAHDQERKTVRAHRLIWLALYGPIPEGKLLRHACDNPPCCNPQHLYLGSDVDNVADRDARLRTATGKHHGRTKLNADDVERIRLGLASGQTTTTLARECKVDRKTIAAIRDGRTWGWLS